MRIAVFADIHGKILLPFKLAEIYQRTTGKKIDVILQCGDMGAFPYLESLDKATIKHIKYDRNELGFHDDFTKENPQIRLFLDTLELDMICVRGNHEDHDFLDDLEEEYSQDSRFPIDVYQRVWVCKTGHLQTFEKEGEILTFSGVGRIGDRKKRNEGKFIQEYEKKQIKRLISKTGSLDILLSHDKDDSSERGYGMPELREILDNVPASYHFHGHTGEPYNERLDDNGITTIVKIKELEFERNGALPYGCMVVLEKKGEDFTMEVVDEKITNPFTKHQWKNL